MGRAKEQVLLLSEKVAMLEGQLAMERDYRKSLREELDLAKEILYLLSELTDLSIYTNSFHVSNLEAWRVNDMRNAVANKNSRDLEE